MSIIHPHQGEPHTGQTTDWLILANLLQINGYSIFDDHVLKANIGQYWNSTESEIKVDKENNRLTIIQRSLQKKTVQTSYLYSVVKTIKTDSPFIPAFIRDKFKKELEPYLTETHKTLPLHELLCECSDSLRKALVFLYKIFDYFIDYIVEVFANLAPSDLLFHHLYYGSIITLNAEELLLIIRAQYPDYSFHPSIDINYYNRVQKSYRLQENKTSDLTADEPPRRINIISSRQDIFFTPLETPDELDRANYLLPEFEFFQFTVKEKIQNKMEASMRLLNCHEAFCREWDGDIQLTSITDLSSNNIGNFKADLRETFFPSYRREIPKVFETEFFDKIIKLIFKGELNDSWTVFESSTNNRYFNNEYSNYLWIAFNDKTFEVVLIAGTDYP